MSVMSVASAMLLKSLVLTVPQQDAAPACAPGVHAVAPDDTLIALPLVKADRRKVTGMLGAMLLGPVGGNKMKVKTVLPGMSASTRLAAVRPAFRFCFAAPAAASGASSDYVGVTAGISPRDYQLVRFEVHENQRQLTLAAVGGFGGPEGKVSQSAIPFTSEEVAPGQYRVIPSRDLEPGQYGFISIVVAPASTRKKDVSEKVYDFAVAS
jgi:hypothetical protein